MKVVVLDIKKEDDVVEKVGAACEEGTFIESTMEKATEISKDDAKTIKDEKDLLMEVPTAASDIGLESVIDIEKKYGVSEAIGKAPSKP